MNQYTIKFADKIIENGGLAAPFSQKDAFNLAFEFKRLLKENETLKLSRDNIKWEDRSTTPEQIVSRIGNIANRSDVKEVQTVQVNEIRTYAANELENIAKGIQVLEKLEEDAVSKYTAGQIARIMFERATNIREGK